MSPEDILGKIRSLAEPLLVEMGLEIVDLEFRREGQGWILRFFIDKEGGVTLDDCADFSREIDTLLEVEDLISSAYRLEVSSPGLDRPLKKVDDFRRFAGRLVKVKMREKVDPDGRGHQRKTFAGELLGIEEGVVLIRQSDSRGGEVALPYDGIEKANLELDF